jgi:hypothetical protein
MSVYRSPRSRLWKENCTRMFSKTIQGFSEFWYTVENWYNYGYSAPYLIKIGWVVNELWIKNIPESGEKSACSVAKKSLGMATLAKILVNLNIFKHVISYSKVLCRLIRSPFSEVNAFRFSTVTFIRTRHLLHHSWSVSYSILIKVVIYMYIYKILCPHKMIYVIGPSLFSLLYRMCCVLSHTK